MSDIDYSIRIVDEDGNAVEGAKVFVSYPTTWHEDFTDDDGWVHFSKGATMHGGVRADIYVNGDQVDEKVWIEDGDTFSYTV